ncbi:MAG: Lrp/AsnC family transcriptional regulator [Methanomicrobiales archaeon]|nr:Lrp/AsnC family transcriptional regulator [Methanomicrobiales archaeon]
MSTPLQQPDRSDLLLLDALQDDLPLTPRPWLEIGERLGMTEGEVIRRLERLTGAGIIRGISPIFESRPLGLQAGTLVALRVPEEKIEETAAIVSRCPAVSHNFGRDHEYALWFTVSARDREEAAGIVAGILRKTGLSPADCLDLPTIRKIKIDVRFPLLRGNKGET